MSSTKGGRLDRAGLGVGGGRLQRSRIAGGRQDRAKAHDTLHTAPLLWCMSAAWLAGDSAHRAPRAWCRRP